MSSDETEHEPPSDRETNTEGLMAVLDTTQRVLEIEEKRRDTFREELQDDSVTSFERTRDIITDEYTSLNELNELLATEREQLDRLLDESSHLTVNQAVRHREQTASKLERHIDALQRFHDELNAALDAIETNLAELEQGESNDLIDSQKHIRQAANAIDEHNEAVEGLGTNFRILTAYLP